MKSISPAMKREPSPASGSSSSTPSGVAIVLVSSYSTGGERYARSSGAAGRDGSGCDGCCASRRGRPERLGADGVLELGALYRGAAADLAYARRRFPGDPVVGAPGGAARARRAAAVYGQGSRRGGLWAFLSRGYWQRVAERPVLLAVAWAAAARPGGGRRGCGRRATRARRSASCPASLQAAADPPPEGRDFGAAEGAAFSFQVLTNNIQVTLMAFAGGILFGVGTVPRSRSTG